MGGLGKQLSIQSICKDRDVFGEHLSSREKEVVDMMMTLFDEEQVMRAYVENERKKW